MNRNADHGPLPALLYLLTSVAGLVDAVSYLSLGRVFVANMTGNIVFLGLAAAGATEISVGSSLVATVAFLAGALAGGRLGLHFGSHRARLLALAMLVEVSMVAITLLVARAPSLAGPAPGSLQMLCAGLLAATMGLQSATARRIGVPDLSTTVLTMTITGLAADSSWAGGRNRNARRRLLAAAAMILGAATGAALLRLGDLSIVLGLVIAILAGVWAIAHRASDSLDSWTVPGG